MNKNNILIVEDDAATNQTLCEYMEVYFDNVYSAVDGLEGLKLYKEYKPSVIFTDIQMPHLDGLELTKIIRENDKDTIIVIISAYTEKTMLLKAIELQLLTYMIKPIKPYELKQTILNILNQLNNNKVVNITESTQYLLTTNQLFINDQEIELTLYEKRLLTLLLQKQGVCVSYEDISVYVYDLIEFSKDSISSLVKRLRKKIGKDIIVNCFNEGYKI